MKKHKFWRLSAAAISVILLGFTSLLAGCKSAPAGRPVDPLELIDDKSSFYIAVPKAADTVLVERIISGYIKQAAPSDAKLIASHVDKVYAGLNRSKNNIEFQAAVKGKIPRKYLPRVLNEKNNWHSLDYTPENSVNSYKVFNGEISLSVPEEYLACIGRDVTAMLDKYDSLAALPAEDTTELYSSLDEELTSYLKGAENEIRFFANKPQSFLTILTGAQLDLKLIDVKGSFVTDPQFPSQYFLTLDFRFKNGIFLKAGKTLLTLAFGLTNSQEEIIGDSELIIQGIRIDKQQLYKLLSL